MTNIGRRAILDITKVLIGSIINKIPIQQEMVEKLSEILRIQRCVIFKLSSNNVSGICDIELTAGIPSEEHIDDIDLKEPISKHPDIEEAAKRGKVMVITNPKNSPLTAYFRPMIERKDITQILYLPLISELSNKTIGVIVVDTAEEKLGFEPEEIEFCGEVAELISSIIGHEEVLMRHMRDIILNRTTSLGGFAARLEKMAKIFSSDAQTVFREMKEIERVCTNGGGIDLV